MCLCMCAICLDVYIYIYIMYIYMYLNIHTYGPYGECALRTSISHSAQINTSICLYTHTYVCIYTSLIQLSLSNPILIHLFGGMVQEANKEVPEEAMESLHEAGVRVEGLGFRVGAWG